jgi:3-oxoacyl-[acyl-carrier-protein] synthase-3
MIASSNANYALVVGSESLSRLVDWNDRSTAVLFGDGAGAAIVAKSNETHRGCISFILGAEGSEAKDLYLVQPERSRTFERPAPIVPYIYMNGKKVYDFAVRSITMLIEKMLQQTATSLDDFAWIVPHQANARIVQAAAKRLSIPLEKFYIDIEEYANTSAASIPIALAEMSEKGLLKPNDLIMLVGFGAGLTYGAAALRW